MSDVNKTDLIYATGLSIDKKRFNYITENINYDKDFTSLLERNLRKIKTATSRVVQFKVSLHENETTSEMASFLAEFISEVYATASALPVFGRKVVKPVSGKIISVVADFLSEGGDSNRQELEQTNPTLFNKTIDKKIPNYTNGDFFSLYLSHQSDACGVAPISKISDSKGIDLTHIYCDRPYYENEYIDHILLKVDNRIFSGSLNSLDPDDIENTMNMIFDTHICDILLSKIINDISVNENADSSKVTNSVSFVEMSVKNKQKNDGVNIKDVMKSLSERNFFGISLLSLILYSLLEKAKETKYIDSINTTKLGFLIDHKIKELRTEEVNDEKIKKTERFNKSELKSIEFLKELFSMSSDPSEYDLSSEEENPAISARIYFSDGILLTSDAEFLSSDILCKNFYRTDHLSIIDEEPVNFTDSEKESNAFKNNAIYDFYEKIIKPTIFPTNSSEAESLDALSKKIAGYPLSEFHKNEYVVVKATHTYIKVPIKMVLSLPIGSNGQADADIFLPVAVSDVNKDIDVLTVGGAEHNRALAHLVNKHRMEYKENRLFGFMDNYFDFQHKIEIDSVNKGEESANTYHNFFMGINQPVAGWNYILNLRTDDSIGNSINSDVKLIGFRLKSQDRKINVLSIYGFSALASVLGVHLIVSDLMKRKVKNHLFSDRYSYLMDTARNHKDRGSAATIFFYRSIKGVVENKDNLNSLCKLIESHDNEGVRVLLKRNPSMEIRISELISKIVGTDSFSYLFNKDINMYNEIFSWKEDEEGWRVDPIIVHHIRRGRSS